jgi:hypothetical protein
LFVIAMTGVFSASGQTVIVVSQRLFDALNNKGTLLFGSTRQQDELEEGVVDNCLFSGDHSRRGALTIERPRADSNSFRRMNPNMVSRIGSNEVGFMRLGTSHNVPRTYRWNFPARQDQGISAMQIAFASEEGLSPADITPVSEVGTWLFAPLGMLIIAYSQRRRIARLVRRPLHSQSEDLHHSTAVLAKVLHRPAIAPNGR